jgi:hypothetical protein
MDEMKKKNLRHFGYHAVEEKSKRIEAKASR